jgi:hypothetical protein
MSCPPPSWRPSNGKRSPRPGPQRAGPKRDDPFAESPLAESPCDRVRSTTNLPEEQVFQEDRSHNWVSQARRDPTGSPILEGPMPRKPMPEKPMLGNRRKRDSGGHGL